MAAHPHPPHYICPNCGSHRYHFYHCWGCGHSGTFVEFLMEMGAWVVTGAVSIGFLLLMAKCAGK